MNPAHTPASDSDRMLRDAGEPRAPRALPLWLRGLLAALLVAAVVIAGRERLDAPWLGGDEVVFIAENPAVTGEPGPDGVDPGPLSARLPKLFIHVHEDLYQPIPLATYAVEWQMWGAGRIFFMRLTDVLIHGLNGLLLWSVLVRLAGALGIGCSAALALVSWGLAALWTLHPVHVGTWAADMGRTHLLSATFSLIALRCYLSAMTARGNGPLVGLFAALTAAMLCKPVVGFVGLAFVLEWAVVGVWRGLRAPRLYVAAALCGAFAVLTIYTTRAAGMLEETGQALFGDPLTRSLLAVFLYARNIVAPVGWLSTWYLPDVATRWQYPPVWGGLAIVLLSVACIATAARSAHYRGIVIGLGWFWAFLLPVIGVVGGRVAAAQDRYLYQPLMGVMLMALVLLMRWIAPRADTAGRARPAAALTVLAALCGVLLVRDIPLAAEDRSLLQRAGQVLALNPGDPRALRMLVAGYETATVRDTPEYGFPPPPQVEGLVRDTLAQAAAAAEARPECFRDAADRAAFHRWLSWHYFVAGDRQTALKQAQRAAEFEGDSAFTLSRLAHAWAAVGRPDEAVRLFEQLEKVLPADPAYRALRLTDFGDLLLDAFDRPDLALEKYRKAYESGVAPAHTIMGLARCEVLAGEGGRGYELIRGVLERDRENVEANLVLGMYYLRSHKWKEAEFVYEKILAKQPALVPALIGYQEVCAQLRAWRKPVAAWEKAARLFPEERGYASFLVWSLACAGDPQAMGLADQILERDPNNPFASYAKALVAMRLTDWDAAMGLVRDAAAGTPVPGARETARARATIRLMTDRGELPAEAVFVEATILWVAGEHANARLLIETYQSEYPESRWRDHAERLLEGEFRD